MAFRQVAAAICLSLMAAGPAVAQTPEDIVTYIYRALLQPGPAEARGIHYLTAPERRRDYLSRRLVAIYDANDTYGGELADACIQADYTIPGNDYDEAELNRTLAVRVEQAPDRQSVFATFQQFGQPVEISYDFIIEDGFWRLDDFGTPGTAARMSSITDCKPKAGGAAQVASAAGAYCYEGPNGTFELRTDAAGQAQFSVDTFVNGHLCGASGVASPVAGGWLHVGDAGCRLGIMVTEAGGFRFEDPDHACKAYLCGHRAYFDGVDFGRETQKPCPPG